MTFVADEGVDSAIVGRLRDEGYQVLYIAEMSPSISDDQVLDQANDIRALLITEDKDFGELVFRLGRIHGGVILLRLHGLSSELKANIAACVPIAIDVDPDVLAWFEAQGDLSKRMDAALRIYAEAHQKAL